MGPSVASTVPVAMDLDARWPPGPPPTKAIVQVAQESLAQSVAAAQTGQTAEVADSITPDPTSKPVAADRSPGLPQQAASSAASRRRAASRRVRSLGAHDNEVHNRSTSRTLRPPCSMVRLRRYCAVSSHWWACQHLGAFHEVSCDLAASAVFQSREQELPRRVHSAGRS